MVAKTNGEESHVSNPVKRIRWATQRVTGTNERHIRQSIKDRFQLRKAGSTDKKRQSGETTNLEGIPEDSEPSQTGDNPEENGRRIYFNTPLPDSAKDNDGHPIIRYERNKIRTAKYTPLSFVPKNLWFQFHNIANIYFLFVILLGVRSSEKFEIPVVLLTSSDLLDIRQSKSGVELRTFDCYPLPHSGQRRYRGLAENGSRQ